MAAVIFQMCLMLMAIATVNQPLLPAEKNGIVPEGGEEMLTRMKEREVSLQLQRVHFEKEIAELEARQEALAWPAREMQRKIQCHTFIMFCLVVPALFIAWRQHFRERTAQQRRY